MYHNRSFRRNRSGCSSGCNSCCNRSSDSSSVTIRGICCRRFENVPMRVYNGPGYTRQDVLESIDDSLQTIAENGAGGQRTSGNRCSC